MIVGLIIIILLPSILAIETTIKSEFKTGETFQAKFSGNFIDPVLRENVAFYRVTGGKHTLIPTQYDVIKIDDEYYVWANLPEAQDNYTIEIKEARYKVGNSESTDDIIISFKVIEEKAAFQINPGVVYTNDNFEISIQNLLDKKIDINIGTSTVSGDTSKFWFYEPIVEVENKVLVSLKSGEDKVVKFRVDAIKLPSLKNIEINSEGTNYIIPVYVFRNVSNNISAPIDPERNYGFSMTVLDMPMATSTNKTRIVHIKNYGKNDIENISLSFSGILTKYLTLSENNISELKSNESKKIELYFKSGIEEKEIEGQMKANIEDANYIYIPIYLNITKGQILANGNNDPINPDPSCYKCGSNEACSIALDQLGCCQGLCEQKEEGKDKASNWGKIAGWVIIGVVIIFLIWFFKFKYKGAKRKKVDLFKKSKK